MFEGADFPKSLNELEFEEWLENGRNSKISYSYMLVIWDEFDAKYSPVYIENREKISEYELYGTTSGQVSLVAAYDLYSQSRVYVERK